MLTARLAHFVTETKMVPEDVLEAAKVALADTLGVGIAGSAEPAATIALAWAQETGGRPQATVLDAAGRVLGPAGARDLYALACRVDELPDVRVLTRATVPR